MLLLVRGLCSSFPGGLSGAGLLILRAALGGALAFEGLFYFQEPGLSAAGFGAGLTALCSGFMLLAGFLTPIAGLVAAFGAGAIGLSILPVCETTLFGGALSLVLAGATLVSLLLQGPGAFSLDARLFGRREIIIPLPPSGSHK